MDDKFTVPEDDQKKPWEQFIHEEPQELEKMETDDIDAAGESTSDTETLDTDTSFQDVTDEAEEESSTEPDRQPYTSKYDAYRFQSSDDGTNSERKQESDEGPTRFEQGTPDGPRRNSPIQNLLMAVGLFAALVLAVIAIVFGVGRLRNSKPAGLIESKPEIVLGQTNSEASVTSTVSSVSSTEEVAESDTDAVDSVDSEPEMVDSVDTESSIETDSQVEDETAVVANAEASDADLTIPEIVKKVLPSMVSITNISEEEYRNIFGQIERYQDVSSGSGILVGKTDTELLVATNNHVISDSNKITVTFCDDEAVEGTLKGADADNDLAIVAVPFTEIPEDTQNQISIIAIGDSDEVEVGESVVAIGNALGYGQSVSSGIISALNRVMTDSDGSVRTMIQTDASINPGNSGGALLNMKGELIGINEAKLVDTSVEGVGYAIPMATAEPILQKLGSKETRTEVSDEDAGYLGVTVMTVPTSATSSGYPSGVYVSDVTENGPAAEAGLSAGDVITAVDGTSVKSSDELLKQLKFYAAGESVNLSVSRLNDDRTAFTKVSIDVVLGSRTSVSETTGAGSTDSEEERRLGGNYGSLFGDDANGLFNNN